MTDCIDHGFSTGTTARGYKKVSHEGVQTYLHRVILATKLHKGEREINVVLHTCDNPRCINPEHMVEGTQLDNVKDMLRKGRNPKGEKHGKCVLSEADCAFILKHWEFRCPMYGTAAMARRFGVAPSTVSTLLHASNRAVKL